MACSISKRISSYKAYLTTQSKQGDTSDLYIHQTVSKSNSKTRLQHSNSKTPYNNKQPVKSITNTSLGSTTRFNHTKSFVSTHSSKYQSKSNLQSHKLEPKILIQDNAFQQLTQATPSSMMAGDKENFIFREDSASPTKPCIIEGQHRSRLLSARVSNIQNNIQLQPRVSSGGIPYSPQQKLVELTKQQSYPRNTLKNSSFVHLNNSTQLFSNSGSQTSRPQTTMNNLSSFADQILQQKYGNRPRNESISSNNTQRLTSSMIKTFHRQSGISHNGRSSTITSASSKKNKIHSLSRKEKFKSYFRNYLNTNKDQAQSQGQLNLSGERQLYTSGSHLVHTTTSRLQQKYSFAETQESGFLLAHSAANIYPQLTPRSQNFEFIKSNMMASSGRTSTITNTNSQTHLTHDQKLPKSISSTSIQDRKCGYNKISNNNIAVLSEEIKLSTIHQQINRNKSKTPVLTLQKHQSAPYQTEYKGFKKSATTQSGYKPRQIRAALTQTMILTARPESKQLVSPPQSSKINHQHKPSAKQPAYCPKKIFDLTKPMIYSNYSTSKKKSFHHIKQSHSGCHSAVRSPDQPKQTKPQNEQDDKTPISVVVSVQREMTPPAQRSKSTNIQDYTLGKKLGEGAYAVVHTAFNKKTNDKLAMKIYDKEKILSNESRKRSVSREIQLLKRLDHPNIVKLYESIDTRKSLNLVMEHVEGKSLYDYVKEKNYSGRFIPESDVKEIIRQLLTGVGFMHQKNIAHRDLKLDNILLIENKQQRKSSDGQDLPFIIKIIDFGFSVTTEKPSKQFCGTPSYMAPEIVKKLEYDPKATDIWALGILAYRMLYGVPPFRAPTEKELYSKIIKGSYYFPSEEKNDPEKPLPTNVSNEAKDIIQKMLQYKQQDRSSAQELLKHQWFNTRIEQQE